eukprot:NODE_667_length_4902_cov_0.676660.p1 type:complete len:614 gc:universal NODE_667_length_4902_cov_0.676660:1480-3321(+)
MIYNKAKSIFTCSNKQYGYQPNRSVSDVVFDVNAKINDLRQKNIPFRIRKLDVKGAFDCLSRNAIYKFLAEAKCSAMLKNIIWELSRIQMLRLRLGQSTSHYIDTNRGVIQGGVLSPKIFAKILDSLFEDWNESNGFIFIFADDILAIELLKDTQYNILDDISVRLATVGLELAIEKCEIVGESFTKYLGYWLNKNGLDMRYQIKQNLSNAHGRLAELVKMGVFKNAIEVSKLLRCIGTYLLPILEFGLQIWNTTAEDTKSIDKFIKNTIRDYTGVARMTPLPELYKMYSFDTFYQRWTSRHLSFHNHRIFIEQSNEQPIYFEKIPMTFKQHHQMRNISQEYPGIKRIFHRNLPIKPIDCPICNQTHPFANGTVKCLKSFVKSLNVQSVTLNSLDSTRTMLDIDMYLLNHRHELLKDRERDMNYIYTDGSLNSSRATCGYVHILNDQITYNACDITHLSVKSSTRAEIIAVLFALETIEHRNLPIQIYSDSKCAISNITRFKEGCCFSKFHSADLLGYSSIKDLDFQIDWIKGHNNDPGNTLADLLCKLNVPTHAHLDRYTSPTNRAAARLLKSFAKKQGGLMEILGNSLSWGDSKKLQIKIVVQSILKEYFK